MTWPFVALGAAVAAAGAAGATPYLRHRIRSTAPWTRYWLHVPIAAILGALAGATGSPWEQVAFVVAAVAASLLVIVDLADWELPDVLTLGLYPVLAITLAMSAWSRGDFGPLAGAGIGALAMFVLYFVLARFARDLGFGDVKLAGVIGGVLGWFGAAEWTLGFLAAWVSMAAISLLLLATKRLSREDSLPFGPWMILGAVVGVLLGPTLLPSLA